MAERIGRIDGVDDDRTSLLRRLRAVVLLLVMVVVIGVVLAGTFGVIVVGLASFIDQALE